MYDVMQEFSTCSEYVLFMTKLFSQFISLSQTDQVIAFLLATILLTPIVICKMKRWIKMHSMVYERFCQQNQSQTGIDITLNLFHGPP